MSVSLDFYTIDQNNFHFFAHNQYAKILVDWIFSDYYSNRLLYNGIDGLENGTSREKDSGSENIPAFVKNRNKEHWAWS